MCLLALGVQFSPEWLLRRISDPGSAKQGKYKWDFWLRWNKWTSLLSALFFLSVDLVSRKKLLQTESFTKQSWKFLHKNLCFAWWLGMLGLFWQKINSKVICESKKLWINLCVIPWKGPISFTPISRGRNYVAMLDKAHMLLSNQEVNNIKAYKLNFY